MQDRTPLLKPKEVAQQLNLPLRQVYYALQTGLLRAYRLPGQHGKPGSYRIAQASVEEYLSAHEVRGTERTQPPRATPQRRGQPFKHVRVTTTGVGSLDS